ncbi:ATP-binding protein [Streptosporangium sp. DT93]|uniref:ATP-binding protein n=1 Tax=Streptosporangium sp. DT93 TaxID=3393428 RepID=UPI003CF5653B
MFAEYAPAPDTGVCIGAGGRFRTTVWCLPPGDAARRARRLLRDLLPGPPFAAHEVADLEVVVTELAANAAGHAPGPYELRVLYDRDRGLPVRVEVVDAGGGAADRASPAPPVLRPAGGRGAGARRAGPPDRRRVHRGPVRGALDPAVRHRPARDRRLVRPTGAPPLRRPGAPPSPPRHPLTPAYRPSLPDPRTVPPLRRPRCAPSPSTPPLVLETPSPPGVPSRGIN